MDKLVLPRVTAILSPYSDFSKVPPDTLAAAGERGTAVHKFCEAYALGFYYPLIPELAGYGESFKSWFKAYVVEVLAV